MQGNVFAIALVKEVKNGMLLTLFTILIIWQWRAHQKEASAWKEKEL